MSNVAAFVVVMGLSLFMIMANAQVAPTPAEGPTTMEIDCTINLANMSDCLTFVEAGSNLSKPDKNCCPAFAGLVESSPICLCKLLGNQINLGLSLDMAKSLTLPTVCKVDTPSVSLCADIGIPVGSPMASSKSPGGDSVPSPSPGGEAGGPSKGSSSIVERSFALIFFGLLSSVVVADLVF